MTEVKDVKTQELQELYAKAYAYKKSQSQIKDEQTRKGYLRYLGGSAEGLVKLKTAYDQMYPDESEGSEAIQNEINDALKFDPAMVAVYIKNIVQDLAELYAKAFKLFLENMKPKQKADEQESVKFSEPEEKPKRFEAQTPISYDQPKKKQSIWSKLFARNGKSVEKVSEVEILAEKAKENRASQKQLEDERLARYNASVKARAMANEMQASFGEEKTQENAMQRSA